jgi:cytochrome P450
LPFEKKKLEKGRYALKTLKKEMLARFKKFPEEGDPSNPANYYFRIVQNKEGFEDEDRVCTGMILFIWAAYIECASLMTNSLIAINKYNPDYVDIVLKEVQAQDSKEDISPSDFGFWSGLDNTLGVLRESLRLIPPGGGTPRYSKEDFEFRGFRIPAGTAVMMDPRVGNTDPTLFTAPDEFKPTRWVPEKKSSSSSSGCPFQGTALKLGFGSWFPGGFGAHQCPGIPLAELTSKIFLAKTVQEFDGWSFGGGTKKRTGDVKFVEVPIKIPVDDFGVNFSLRN